VGHPWLAISQTLTTHKVKLLFELTKQSNNRGLHAQGKEFSSLSAEIRQSGKQVVCIPSLILLHQLANAQAADVLRGVHHPTWSHGAGATVSCCNGGRRKFDDIYHQPDVQLPPVATSTLHFWQCRSSEKAKAK
jgi:hypothetical protein